VELMFEDLEIAAVLSATGGDRRRGGGADPRAPAARRLYADWLKLNEIEVQRGEGPGAARIKLTSVEEMLAALGAERSGEIVSRSSP